MTIIAIQNIIPNPEQPRKVFDQAELESLAQSIRENGVVQPVTVEATDDAEIFILQDGERRVRAARLAGLSEVEAFIMPAMNGSGKQTRLVRALVANLQRSDLNPIEEARGYQRLRNQNGDMTIREISKRTGMYESRITSRLRLLEIEGEIQDMIAAGKFPKELRVINAMLELPQGEMRVALARKLSETRAGIKTCIMAAQNLKRSLERAERGIMVEGEIPAVQRAVAKLGAPNRQHWDMLQQSGQIPPWPMVEGAARAVCHACVLREVASTKVCDQCPGVFLIGRLIEKVNKHGC